MLRKTSLQKILVLIGLMIQLTLVIAMAGEPVSNMDTVFIKKQDNTLYTGHAIQFAMKIPINFDTSEILHYYPEYHGHPFEVSAIAAFDDQRIVMLHAERVIDQSGFLNYSYLAKDTLCEIEFYTQERCIDINSELLSRSVDLQFFKEAGFEYGSALYIKQYFKTSDDGNAEIVIGYAESVCNCSDKTLNDSFRQSFKNRLKANIRIEKLN